MFNKIYDNDDFCFPFVLNKEEYPKKYEEFQKHIQEELILLNKGKITKMIKTEQKSSLILLNLFYQKLSSFFQNDNSFNNDKTKLIEFLKFEELEMFSIKGKTTETIKKEFDKLLLKLDKQCKNQISFFNTNKTFFIIKGINIFIDNGWNKHLLEKALIKINEILNPFIYDTKEKKAFIQDTHNFNSSYDFFSIIYPINNKFDILKIENNIISMGYTFKNLKINEILIIENKECFFRYKEFLNPKYFNNLPNLNNVIIIFGEGNAITTKKLIPFLKKYQKIHCFFDYDEGGFQIFNNLDHNNKIFHYPKKEILKNVIELIYYHQEKQNNIIKKENIENVFYKKFYYDIIKNSNFILNRKEIIRIEQEIFLNKGLENVKNFK